MASPDKPEKPDKDPKPKKIRIEVNGNEVIVTEREMTGAEIKAAAIEQGVNIQPNFVLQLELPNGTSKVIAETEEVKVHNHMSFTAIAPDDNS
jgi:hypothetical protein